MTAPIPAGPEVLVKRVEVADVQAADALLTRFFLEEGFALPAEGLETRIRTYLLLDHHAIFEARSGSEMVGAVTVCSGFSLEYGRYAEIEDLYVLPAARRRGVARALVDAAAGWAWGDGCSQLIVTITQEGQASHHLLALYSRLGFVDDGRFLLSRPLT